MSLAGAILRTMHPRQWVKNAFVAAPLVFSKNLFEFDYLLPTGIAVASFCCLSGAVYAMNDAKDVEEDRRHPVKRFRPIAAGEISERAAYALSLVLALLGLGGALYLGPLVLAAAAGYLVNNVAYTFGLKNVPFLDVAMISIGFILRVAAGGLAIGVDLSPWLFACTALLSSLLGFGKRAHELKQASAKSSEETTRVSLAGYRLRTLRRAMAILAVLTCASYAFYTQDARTVAFFGTRTLIWTLPFCVVGIARFAQLALWKAIPHSPTDAILRDPPFLLNIVAWGATVIQLIYQPFF